MNDAVQTSLRPAATEPSQDLTPFIERVEAAFAVDPTAIHKHIVSEFHELPAYDKVVAWAQLTQKGADRLDFAKFVHAHTAWSLVEVFQTNQVDVVGQIVVPKKVT